MVIHIGLPMCCYGDTGYGDVLLRVLIGMSMYVTMVTSIVDDDCHYYDVKMLHGNLC